MCGVLVGHPGVLIFTPTWRHSQPPQLLVIAIQEGSKEVVVTGIHLPLKTPLMGLLCSTGFPGHLCIVTEVNNSQ